MLNYNLENKNGNYKMKKTESFLYTLSIACILSFAAEVPASVRVSEISEQHMEAGQESPAELTVGKYGMLPIYGVDVKDGVYSIDVESNSTMFHIVKEQLTVDDRQMEAVLTLSGKGYLRLFMGDSEEAAGGEESTYIDFEEDGEGMYTYTVPVEALDKPLDCAAFSERKEKWYDRVILFNAASLPEDALLVDLPDYDLIESALEAWNGTGTAEKVQGSSDGDTVSKGEQEQEMKPVEPMDTELEDGEYAIEVSMAGGSGKSTIVSPTILTVKNGKAYARIQWSSSNYDYMIVGTKKYLNANDGEGNSVFDIAVAALDSELPVIADTTAMGEPREIAYTLTFYSDTIGPKSQLPQEAAKRVVYVALLIIVGGGILNHFVNKKKRC